MKAKEFLTVAMGFAYLEAAVILTLFPFLGSQLECLSDAGYAVLYTLLALAMYATGIIFWWLGSGFAEEL